MNGPFRSQAIQCAFDKSTGTILLARPMSLTFLTLFFVGIVGAVVIFFVEFSASAKAELSGVLLPVTGLLRVVSPQGGLVVGRFVHEGQTVNAGDLLFVLRNDRTVANGQSAEASISSLLQSRRHSLQLEAEQQYLQSAQRIAAMRRRIDDLGAEARRITDEISLQHHRVGLAQAAVDRYRQLQTSSFVSDAAVQDKQADLIDQRQRLAELERAAAANHRDLAAAEADLQDQKFQQQRNTEGIKRSIAALDQDLTENEIRREVQVHATQDGTVSAILVEAGQIASAGQPLATLVPVDSELEANLYATSRSAGFLRAGMPVQIRYQAYPYQKFGQFQGQVRDVSLSAVAASELTALGLPQVRADEPLYRVHVTLERQVVHAYGIEHPLKPGMSLDASVQLERRRLFEWALEPAFSITGSL